MEPNYSWIYLLIFLMIPLARVLPRILRRAGLKPNIATRPETPRGNFFKEPPSDNFTESPSDNFTESPSDNFTESPSREEFSTKNWPKEKIVLGLLMTNISKFEELQKRGNLSVNNLDRILQELERRGCMKPVEKSGPFGKSIELKITEKALENLDECDLNI